MQSLNDLAMSIKDFFSTGAARALGALLLLIILILQKPIFDTIFSLFGEKKENDLLKWSDYIRHKKSWLFIGALYAFGLLLFGIAEVLDLWKRFIR